MTKVEFECPKCRRAVMAPSSLEGEESPCPKCGQLVERWSIPKAPLVPSPSQPPPIPKQPGWFYVLNGYTYGPVEESQLRALIETGMIRPTDLVWREGMDQWYEARWITGLVPTSLIPPPLPAHARNEPQNTHAKDHEEEEPMGCLVLGSTLFFTMLIPIIGLIVGAVEMGKGGRRANQGLGILLFAIVMILIYLAQLH